MYGQSNEPSDPFVENPDLRFELMLARDLGMTRAELRRRMGMAEYNDWIVFYQLEQRERERAMNKARRG